MKILQLLRVRHKISPISKNFDLKLRQIQKYALNCEQIELHARVQISLDKKLLRVKENFLIAIYILSEGTSIRFQQKPLDHRVVLFLIYNVISMSLAWSYIHRHHHRHHRRHSRHILLIKHGCRL